jgi:hypothetical protein
VLAIGADPSVEVVAIDPHAGNDRGPQEIEGFVDEAETDHERFEANLAAAGVGDRVDPPARSSPTRRTTTWTTRSTCSTSTVRTATARHLPTSAVGREGVRRRHAADPRQLQQHRGHAGDRA